MSEWETEGTEGGQEEEQGVDTGGSEGESGGGTEESGGDMGGSEGA
jgi:hypothetical protein